MLTPCQKCLRSFLTLPSAFILSDFVDYTEFSGVSGAVLLRYFFCFTHISKTLHYISKVRFLFLLESSTNRASISVISVVYLGFPFVSFTTFPPNSFITILRYIRRTQSIILFIMPFFC